VATSFPVSVRIGAALDASVGTAFGRTEQLVGRLGDSISQLEGRARQAEQYRQLRQKTSASMEAWRGAEERARTFAAAMAEVQRPTQAQTQRMERLREEVDRSRMAYRQNQQDLARMDTELRRAGVDTERLAVEQVRLGSEVRRLQGHYASLGQAMAQVHAARNQRAELRSQIGDAIALGGALYGIAKPAIEFETVLGDIDKVVDFKEGTVGLQKMGDALKLMAREIPISQAGLGAIAAAGGRMGIKEGDLLTYTQTVAKMAAAWEMPPEAAGEAMAKIQNVMGFPMEQLMRVGDAINKLDDSSAAKAPEILDVLKRTSGMGKQFGLTTQQLAGLATTMLDLGRTPEVAATGINALLMKLQAAPIQTKKFKEALKSLGYTPEDIQKAIGKDAVGTLTGFLEKVSKLEPNQRVNILGQMFGMEYSDDLAILVGGLDKYKEFMGLVAKETNYAGSVQAEFDKRSKLTANQLKLLGTGVNEVAINIGNALLPGLNALIGTALPVTHAIADLANRFPTATSVIGGTVAAAAGLKILAIGGGYLKTFAMEAVAIGRVGIASARAIIALAGASGVASGALPGATRGVMMLGTALAATPVGWVMAGIAAVAGAAVMIYRNWDAVAAFFRGVWQGIGSALESAGSRIRTALAPLVPVGQALGGAFQWVGSQAAALAGWVQGLISPVTTTAEGLESVRSSGEAVGDVIGRGLVAAFGLVTTPARGMAAVVGAVWDYLHSTLSWSPTEAVAGAWSGLGTAIGGAVQAVGEIVGQAWQRIQTALGFDPLTIITPLWTPVTEFIGDLWARVTALVGTAVDWIAGKLARVSESLAGLQQAGAWIANAASWATLGAFDSKPTQPPPRVGAAVNENRPGSAPVVVVGGTQASPSSATSTGNGTSKTVLVSQIGAAAGGGAPASAAALVAPAPRGAAPAPQPIQVEVHHTINLTAHPDLAALTAQVSTNIVPLIRETSERAIRDAVREAESRRAAALHD
jgi:TP901 family phage tail tape measure protein